MENESSLIFGRNAVLELLKSGRQVDKLLVQNGDLHGSVLKLIGMAHERKIPVVRADRQKLDALCSGGAHQGVCAYAAVKEYVEIEDILAIAEQRGEKPLILIADGIQDPHNLGALIRCAEGAGVHGIIVPKRRSAVIGETVFKSSAGAAEHMAVCRVPSLADAVEKLKDLGLWIFAAEAGGERFDKLDLTCSAAIILGSEGEGVGRLLKEKSDYIISIPMYGRVNSLNVSAAAAVLCYEAARQRKMN